MIDPRSVATLGIADIPNLSARLGLWAKVSSGWFEVVQFTLYIKKLVGFPLEG